MTIDSKYILKKEDVLDAFNVATVPDLKEAYDKHNMFYKKEYFEKKMGKQISTIMKYRDAVNGSLF